MKKLLLLALMVLLSGCSTFSSNNYMADGKPLGNHYLTWPQRQQQLQSLSKWAVAGSLAVRHQVKGGWNASFNWQQIGQNYDLSLFGPLGMNHVQITGSPSLVTLKTNQQTLTANSPEALLQQQLGWQLPVSDLRYWLRGLPAPYSKSRRSLDLNNHMVHLVQDGWNVIYLRYISVNGVDVPDRILMNNPQWNAHLVVRQWDLN